jgi:hypothetical protein
LLVGLAVLLGAVFAVAIGLDPYKDDRVWYEETHRQLGLPPCTFKAVTKLPCPSCGMTSSFALFVRGDLGNSLQANTVGTLLAGFCLFLIPWSVASAWNGRLLFVRSFDLVIVRLVLTFVVLLFVRWGLVLLLAL